MEVMSREKYRVIQKASPEFLSDGIAEVGAVRRSHTRACSFFCPTPGFASLHPGLYAVARFASLRPSQKNNSHNQRFTDSPISAGNRLKHIFACGGCLCTTSTSFSNRMKLFGFVRTPADHDAIPWFLFESALDNCLRRFAKVSQASSHVVSESGQFVFGGLHTGENFFRIHAGGYPDPKNRSGSDRARPRVRFSRLPYCLLLLGGRLMIRLLSNCQPSASPPVNALSRHHVENFQQSKSLCRPYCR